MNPSRRRPKLSEDIKEEFPLQHFRIPGPTVIDTIDRLHNRNHRRRFKRVSYDANSLLLLISSAYLCDMISNNNTTQLLTELDQEISLSRFISLPKEFDRYLRQEVVRSVLRNGCLRVAEAKTEVEVETEMSKVVNGFPFFRCCVVLWARDKAVKYLEANEATFELLIGNQREVLLDFDTQMRYMALDIFSQTFKLKLTLELEQATEVYGEAIQTTKDINVVLTNLDNTTVLIEDLFTKDTETTNTENDTQNDLSGRFPTKSNQSSEIFSAYSPRSMVEGGTCQKCGNRVRLGRCVKCKNESAQKSKKSGLLETYTSVLRVCKGCGKREIIYNELCRKCEPSKPR